MHHLRNSKRPYDTRFMEWKRNYEANKFASVVPELELATIFVETALSSDSDERAKRNLAHARRGYQAATKFMKDSSFTPEMNKIVVKKVAQLRRLPERVQPSAQAKAKSR